MKKSHLFSFLAGLIFAIGLGLSGMTAPAKVLGFLDLGGAWDPSLAFVMVGAIGVHFVGSKVVRRRATPLFANEFYLPSATHIDGKLLIGAALFGIGWGLGGFCPGPVLVTLATGGIGPLVFVLAMAAGMFGHYLFAERPTSANAAKATLESAE